MGYIRDLVEAEFVIKTPDEKRVHNDTYYRTRDASDKLGWLGSKFAASSVRGNIGGIDAMMSVGKPDYKTLNHITKMANTVINKSHALSNYHKAKADAAAHKLASHEHMGRIRKFLLQRSHDKHLEKANEYLHNTRRYENIIDRANKGIENSFGRNDW